MSVRVRWNRVIALACGIACVIALPRIGSCQEHAELPDILAAVVPEGVDAEATRAVLALCAAMLLVILVVKELRNG